MRPLLVVVLLSLPASAAPRDFPLTWTSRTSAAGQSSLEAWLTPRLMRTDDYFRLDTRVVWTHGVTRTVEAQLSMDMDVESVSKTRPQTIDPRFTSLWRWTTWREHTPFAVGGLARLSLGPDQFEVEARLTADWQLDRVLLALNLSAARALFWNGRTGVDTRLEETFAARYLVSPGATFGFEVWGRSSWSVREYQGSALYVGPALTFTHPKFWVTVGGYAQVAAEKAQADRPLAEPAELRDNERFVLRLAFGANT